MRIRTLTPALFLAMTAGCSSILDVKPTNELPADRAIVDALSARAALVGAYSVLQSLSYYGEDFTIYLDVSADNATHTGTYATVADASANRLRAEHGDIAGMWGALYNGINRANEILAKVPTVPGLSDKDRNEILGEAHFLRALHYHNLVKLWGDVPIRTEPAKNLQEASQIARKPVAEVYALITSDLDTAAKFMTDTSQRRQASLGAVQALQARVRLYQKDWAGAVRAADSVALRGYQLAANFRDLFSATGSNTREDIFRVAFTVDNENYLGYWYFSKSYGGRREVAPTTNLANAFEPNDVRKSWTISYDGRGRIYGSKFPTVDGTEHPHVIRFAEVILTKAEALARQDKLAEAVDAYNLIRERAGLPKHQLGVTVLDTVSGKILTTKADVIEAVLKERRLELALEGDRWADLVRNGLVVSTLGLPADRAYQALYPIPQRERDVAPNLTQNPGY